MGNQVKEEALMWHTSPGVLDGFRPFCRNQIEARHYYFISSKKRSCKRPKLNLIRPSKLPRTQITL